MNRKLMMSVLVVLLLFVLFGIQAGFFGRWQSVHDDRDRHAHSKQELLRLQRLVTDVDNGFRGYLLTKDGRFLTPMVAAEGDIPSVMDRLLTMTAPSPDLQAQVQILTGHVNELLETKRRLTMDLVHGREEDVLSYIRNGEGLELANTIALAFQDVERSMDQHDREKTQDRDDVRAWTRVILGATTLGTLALGVSVNRLARVFSERSVCLARLSVPMTADSPRDH